MANYYSTFNEASTVDVYWFKDPRTGERWSERHSSTTAAIDYAKRHGYEFLGTHGHIQMNSCHPNYYLK